MGIISTESFTADGVQKTFTVSQDILSGTHCRVHFYYLAEGDAVADDHAVTDASWDLLGLSTVVFVDAPTSGYVVKVTVSSDGSGLDAAPSEISDVVSNLDNILIVAGIESDVTTVSGIATKVSSLYSDKVTLDSLYADKVALDRLHTSITKIDTVAVSIDNVDTVGLDLDLGYRSITIDQLAFRDKFLFWVDDVSYEVLHPNDSVANIASDADWIAHVVNTTVTLVSGQYIFTDESPTKLSNIQKIQPHMNNPPQWTAVLEWDAVSKITRVSDNIVNVNIVGGVSSDVTKVANITTGDVTKVANIVVGDVTKVADIASDVTTVADVDSDVTTLATDLDLGVTSNLKLTAGSIDNVNLTGGSIANVNTTAASIASVNTVSGIDTEVVTVAGISANTTTVAGISANVTTVAGISGNTATVAGISGNVTTVAGIDGDITTVAGKATQIGLLGTVDAIADMNMLGTAAIVADLAILGTADVVADMNTLGTADVVLDMNTLGTALNVTNMDTLAGISADVTTAAGNIGAILAAPAEASSAASSAAAALVSEESTAGNISRALSDRELGIELI